MLLLSTAYLPNIEYFTRLIKADEIIIESKENFIKQTFRNRATILSPQGAFNIIVPVKGGRSKNKKTITEIEIDYSINWVDNHIKTIRTAYKSAPFFDFFFDEITDILMQKPKHLFELNTKLLKKILKLIELDKKISYTREYYHSPPMDWQDFRYSISPKTTTSLYFPAYPQVFEDKFGFTPNLSIIDLLFNIGNEAIIYLKNIKI